MATATQVEEPLAIDLSAAVLVSRYLGFWRRVSSWSLLICLVGLILRHSAFWVILVAGSILGYAVVRYPRRWSIQLWTRLWMVAAPVVGVWAIRELVTLLREGFSVPLLIDFADICLFFWVTARVSREPASITEQEPGPDTFQSFATLPSFFDRWLSGGWRTSFIVVTVWTFSLVLPWGPEASIPTIGLGSMLFALAVTSVMVLPWALIPVARTLQENSPINLLRAIAQNRARAPYGSYSSFVLRHAPKRPLSLLWLGAFVLLGLGAIGILAWPVLRPPARFDLNSFQTRLLLQSAALPLFSFSLFCWRRARQEVLRGGLKSDSARRQRSTLYLRSFFDDQVKVLRDGLRYRVWLTDPLLSNIRFMRFEEVIADAVWPFGGLIALARPGEKLPELGAVRVAAEGQDWQETIESLMEESQHIVMMVGLTSGLKWEFQQAQIHGRQAKLLLVTPPESAALIAKTWHNFASDFPSLLSCPEELPVRSLAVRFRDNGWPVFLSAEQRSVAAYRLALDACWLPLNDLLNTAGNSSPARQRFGWQLAGTRVAVWLMVFLISSVLFLANAPSLTDLTDPVQQLPASILLSSTGRLRAGNLHFRETQDGPPRSSTIYKPGEAVLITYQVAGVGRDADGMADVRTDVNVRDPAGLQVTEPLFRRFDQAIGYGRRVHGWVGVRLPLYAPPGEYRIDVAVHDELGSGDVKFQPRFQVAAPPATPANDIEIRDLRLSPSKDGMPSKDGEASLHGGGKICMTCAILGLQFRNDHRNATMALTVVAPDGVPVFNQPDFLVVEGWVYYHPANYAEYVTGFLTIPEGFPPGIYTQMYTARDGISGRSTVRTAAFEVK